MIDYNIPWLIELGFKQAISKRLSYKLGPILVAPPLDSLGWYWGIVKSDITNECHKIKTPNNKQEVESL